METTDNNNMADVITNTISTIVSKPAVGITAAFGSTITSILTWLGALTPLYGLITFIGGAIITFYCIKHWMHTSKMDKLEEAEKAESLKKHNIK